MKQHHRVISAFFAILFTVASFSLSACQTDDTPDIRTVDPVAVDHVWKSDYISYPKGVYGHMDAENCIISDDILTFSGIRVVSEEPYKEESVTITFDITGRTFTVDTGEPVVDPGSGEPDSNGYYWHTGTSVPFDGGEIGIWNGYQSETREELYRLYRKDSAGAELWNIALEEQFLNETGAEWFYVTALVVNESSGTVYVSTRDSVCAFDTDGRRLYEITPDGHIDSVFNASDGNTYLLSSGKRAASGQNEMQFCPFDDANSGLGDAITLPETVQLQNADIFMADGADMFYANDEGLYCWNFTDPDGTLLCSWLNSDISVDEANRLIVLSDTLFLRQTTDPVTRTPQIAIMTPMPPEEVKPKYLIEVAYCSTGSMLMQYAATFNRLSDEYRVVLNNYQRYSDTDRDPMDMLEQDIITGYKPDIIVGRPSFQPDNLVDKGLFLDLYTLMDEKDLPMKRDDFVACVLEPFEENGTLPLLTTNFTLSTYYADASVVGNKSVWSIDDIISLEETLSDDQYLFAMFLGSNDPKRARDSKMVLLEWLFPYSLTGFIDEKKAKCTFDDGRFADLLEFCATCPVLDTATINRETDALFREGTLVLKQGIAMSTISEYLQSKYYCFAGRDMAMIGYPTADPDIKNSTVIHAQEQWGITKTSPVRDGAWEFLASTFRYRSQNAQPHNQIQGFSASRSALDALFEAEELTYYLFRENGWSSQTITPDDPPITEDDIWVQDNLRKQSAILGHITDEDKEELCAVFENAELVSGKAEAILNLIREDAAAYFAGAKTLDETVEIIQSRVSIYVSEKQG